ncbi:hypothetical protein tinsulaeT_18700 [Thalassotalea insulae]|uniref:Uncharacterized protein n=1 Tax=Thalassotalea insulae TaxID=2056778 RepID=A0ABQ6GV49_9GAMM|nr:hypothetical protein [Thalassotalea insulae]GLX78530.1 hypothetical protein tinsulaeT_18700 [Thalassotalea insulae]
MQNAFESQLPKSKLTISLNKLVLLVFLLMVMYFGFDRYKQHQTEQAETTVLVLNPQISDIYFLDMRLIKGDLERKNKYKLAKVVRVTDDNVAIVYGRFFYQWQYSVVNSIQYGDLSNDDYFTPIPEYIPLNKIREMENNGAIYLIKRPVRNQLYGNFVRP